MIEDLVPQAKIWKRFEEVTGFVPNECRMIKNLMKIEEGDRSILDILGNYEKIAIENAYLGTRAFGNLLGVGRKEQFLTFCDHASFGRLRGECISSTAHRLNWDCWDLSFVTCVLDKPNLQLHDAMAVSIPAAKGMVKVFLKMRSIE